MAGTEAAFKCFDNYFFFYSTLLKVAPYTWNKKTRKFSVVTDTLNIIYLYGVMYFGVTLTTYGTLRLLKEIFKPDPNFKAHQIIMYVFYILTIFLSTLINSVLVFNGKFIVTMINGAFKFDLDMQNRLCSPTKGKKVKAKKYEKMLQKLMPATFVSALCAASLSFVSRMDPLQRFFIDHIPEIYKEFEMPLKIFTFVGIFLAALYVWSPIILFATAGFIYMNGTVFWFSIINGDNEDRDAKKAVNILQTDTKLSMNLYQSLVILTNDGSQYYTYHALPAALGVAALVLILCNFATVTMYNSIPMPGYMFMPLVSIICYAGFGFGIPQGASVYEESRDCIKMYQKLPNKFIRMRANSFRPVAITAGPFFQLRHTIAVKYFAFVTDFSINLIMAV